MNLPRGYLPSHNQHADPGEELPDAEVEVMWECEARCARASPLWCFQSYLNPFRTPREYLLGGRLRAATPHMRISR
eukprot:6701024-Pyramimonas_sp.AAC.1